MGYERIYGEKVPCPCGKGKAQRYRTEHDTFPTDSDYFPDLEIDCAECDPEHKTWELRDPRRDRPRSSN
jgi:hypothetical protein